MKTIRGWEKNRKNENEKKEKAISQRGYGVDDAEEWSVECGGTIIGLRETTKEINGCGWIRFTRFIDSAN